jgi:hypothetical protein
MFLGHTVLKRLLHACMIAYRMRMRSVLHDAIWERP